MNFLEDLLFDQVRPNHLHEVAWLMDYMQQGNPAGYPIFLSLGETWEFTPKHLLDYLSSCPLHMHGYHLSMYGYPPFRRAIHTYLSNQYGLSDTWYNQELYESAVAATGTRSAMYDYARWLKENYYQAKTPILFTTAPGWDYAGVFSPVGFSVYYHEIQESNGFLPDTEVLLNDLKSLVVRGDFPTVVLNTQHNPTGINWPLSLIEPLIDFALAHDLPILIDDAYFAVHAPSETPTNTLALILQKISEAKKSRYPWFFVRSLGKQYSCNGWGIGMVCAEPTILDQIVNRYQIRHHYNTNGPYQYALSKWLGTDEAQTFTSGRNLSVQSNRELFLGLLNNELGYPIEKCPQSTCTNFQMFPIPKFYIDTPDATNIFVKDCLYKTGVLYTDAWPSPSNTDNMAHSPHYARIFLGVHSDKIAEAVSRMKKADLYFSNKGNKSC